MEVTGRSASVVCIRRGFGRKRGVRDRGGAAAAGRQLQEKERDREREREEERKGREGSRGLVFVIGGAEWRSI